jgi:hypothetical protein
MGLACIAFLGSLFTPLIKHPCPILFHQSINPSTLNLARALFATRSFRRQSPQGPAIRGFTYLAQDATPDHSLILREHPTSSSLFKKSRFCLLLEHNGDLQRPRPHARGRHHSLRGMSHWSSPACAKTSVREGEAVYQVWLCVCLGRARGGHAQMD